MNTTLEIENPYLREAYEVAGDSLYDPGIMGSIEAAKARFQLVKKYAWAIPSQEALDVMASYAPLVEMGAGTGYWAYLLRQMDVDILAYDLLPPDGFEWPKEETREQEEAGHNWYHRGHETWTEVIRSGPRVLRRHKDRTLFLCWPPMSNFAYRSLQIHESKTVIYIGEGEWGCTADSEFHNALARNYKEVKTVEIPQWDGIHDYLSVYERLT